MAVLVRTRGGLVVALSVVTGILIFGGIDRGMGPTPSVVAPKTGYTPATLEEIKNSYPQCFSGPSSSSGLIRLSPETARYVPSTAPPRYDHLSCFVMKARYNCAIAEASVNEASGYKLVLRRSAVLGGRRIVNETEQSQDCDVRQLVDEMGGPRRIGQILSGAHPNRPFQVLMQGNSLLRQVFEALVCGFQDQITDISLLLHGPPIGLEDMDRRRGRPIRVEELGRPVMDLEKIQRRGCHGGGKRMAQFYRNDVSVPPSADGCTDDMAMVEFGHSIRFMFIFRPSMYDEEAILEAYRNLGMISSLHGRTKDDAPADIDLLVWNHDEESARNVSIETSISLESLIPSITAIQNQSIGRYYGADNPWIKSPPDVHPCLPGIPDDEANVLLYLLLTSYDLTVSSR